MHNDKVVNIIIGGIGGTGVIMASNIVAYAAFLAGYDVRKSEIHGMSQRGGSVSSDVRFGKVVYSPMVPDGEGDFLILMHPDELENNLYRLKDSGVVIGPELLLGEEKDISLLNDPKYSPVNQKNFNICLIGVLSTYLDIPYECWQDSIFTNLPQKMHELNRGVFEIGVEIGKKTQNQEFIKIRK
jgi:indolepyruvate ferredoxin oxidoreductase beta subunit